ncbi:unnamed protein product, partial [Candidula unifasciata]
MEQHLLLVIAASLVVCGTSRLIDLSHDHGPDTLMSPNLLIADKYVCPQCRIRRLLSGEHGGTHLDPLLVHFQRGGQQLQQIPLENTIAEGVMIDCSAEAAEDPSFLVPLQKVQTY